MSVSSLGVDEPIITLLVVTSQQFGLFMRSWMKLSSGQPTSPGYATAWVDGIVETLYESFKAGESVTLPGFGGFYVRQEPESWVFKFNPGQRLRALFGWSSTYSGKL